MSAGRHRAPHRSKANQQSGIINLNAEFTDEQLRTSPYTALMTEAIVVKPDEYRSGPPE